jgi:hypothetical protein
VRLRYAISGLLPHGRVDEALSTGLSETSALQDAVVSMETAHALSGGSPFTLGFLAYMHGRAGRSADARRLVDQAGERAAAGYVPPTTFALAHVGLGEWDLACHWLNKAIDGRDPIIMPIKTFPFLDPVRDDARFKALLRKMRLA